jgi:NAD(P)-dependent dehydrogenase (short-subunit alcohol dehydrogenase family)
MRQDRSILERLFSLRGKSVLVTGAGGGIGRVLAVAMAEAGARLGLHDVAPERLAESCHAVRYVGGETFPLVADLSDVQACQGVIAKAHAALNRLDVLVNCAGVNRRKPIEAVTLDDYETITAVNQRSLFFLSQAAHPIMRAQGGGKIINIGSLNSFMGLGTVSVYGMTKAATAQVTKTMAIEWAKDNIQVNCVAPGFMLTPLTETSLWGDEVKRRWLLERIPMRRPGQPDELVGITLLLAAGASSYLTGQTIVVDGGVLAGGSWEVG